MYKAKYFNARVAAVFLMTAALGGAVQEMYALPFGEANKAVAPALYKIKGKVVDDAGEPLPGASIKVKGTDVGTISDVDGNFQFNVTDGAKVTIVVSFVGMESKELQVIPDKFVKIVLSQETYLLNELIVTGFQTISRERSTGAAIIVNSEKLNKIQAPDLTTKLEGMTPGLTTYNNQMSIRGTSSFSVDATPLLVIDGQPATGITINDINPETIENITVLKDAAATALYGVRASNGVIVVTTKQAEDNKVNVNVSLGYYINPLPSLSYQHYASTSDIIDLERDYLLSDPEYIKSPDAYFSSIVNKTSPGYMTQLDLLYYRLSKNEITQDQLNAGLDQLRAFDYRKEYRKNLQHLKLTQDYNLSLSKGGNKSNLFFSARYQDVGQYNKYDDMNKMSFYLKNDLNLASWFRLTLGMDASYTHSSYAQSNGLGATTAMPYDRLYEDDGSLAYRYLYNQVLAETINKTEGLNFMGYNAVEESERNKLKTNDLYLKFFVHTNFDITKDLGLELKFQYEKRNVDAEQYDEEDSYMMRSMINEFASRGTNQNYVYNIPRGGHLKASNANYDYYNLRGQFNYQKVFDEKHDLTALLGGEIRQDKYRALGTERYGYDEQKLTYSQMDWLTLSQTGVAGQLYSALRRKSENLSTAETMHRYVSAYFNAGYTYDSRYSLNASVRVEQADLFGTDPKYRYRPLWSLGGSWNISNEEFMAEAGWINMLKLRFTYGITGNVDQSSSPYLLGSYMTSFYSNSSITSITNPPNSTLRWEKTSTINFGIDYMLFKKLTGSLDVYRRYSTDLLVNKSIDPSIGFDGMARANNGEMQNMGVEISASYNWIKSRDISFTTTLSAAFNKNQIKKVDYEPTDAISMMEYPTSNYKIGDTFNSLYAYRYAGLTENGDPSIYNENGEIVSIDNVRNIGAVVRAGQLDPKWNGALNLDFRWKDLNVFVKAVYYTGHSLRNDVVTLYDPYNPIEGGAIGEDIVNRWTPENTNTNIPAMGIHTNSGERNKHWRYADANVCNASFIKLRNIGVSYSIPQKLLSKAKIKNLTLRAQVDNPCYWAANKEGIDPEAFNANSGSRTAALMPSYIFGLNVNF